MAPSGGYDVPPLLRQRSSWPPLTALLRLGGVLLTLFTCTLLLVLAPFVVVIRLFAYVKRRSRRWHYAMRICSHQWPLAGKGTDFGVMCLNQNVEPAVLNEHVENLPMQASEISNSVNDLTGDLVKMWNQGEKPLKNAADLSVFLNENTVVTATTKVQVVHGFRKTAKRRKCLVLVSNSGSNCHICVPRMMNILSNQRMYIEMEPLPAYHFFVPFRQQNCCYNALVVSYRFITQGPSSLLSLLFRGPSPLWQVLAGGRGNTRNRRGLLIRRHSSAVLMESAEDGKGKAAATSHVRCWRRIPNSDLLGRAEHLLRASSCEMMLALVAGTLRSYCRQQNVMHPPDLGVVVPVSCRNFLPIACGYPCDVITLPFMLPTGVEGAIPRVWSIQKRLYNSLNSHLPSTLKVAQIIARSCCTKDKAADWLKPLHSSHSIHVAFYRASGDLRVTASVGLDSLLIFPALSSTIKASFVFVQCGRETYVCASLCKNTFPNPESVLRLFETETRQLLEHLSLRLLSLPQTTFLPGVAVFPERIEEEQEELHAASEYLRQKTAPTPVDDRGEDEEYTLEELHKLLATVQSELDGMRANPQGDRTEYIRKLSELEHHMQRFHDSISEKLGVEPGPKSEDGQLVDAILAPYKDVTETSSRRFSREFLRTDENARRRSSRSFSP